MVVMVELEVAYAPKERFGKNGKATHRGLRNLTELDLENILNGMGQQ